MQRQNTQAKLSETFQRLTVDGCAKVEEEVTRRDGGDGASAALEDVIHNI